METRAKAAHTAICNSFPFITPEVSRVIMVELQARTAPANYGIKRVGFSRMLAALIAVKCNKIGEYKEIRDKVSGICVNL